MGRFRGRGGISRMYLNYNRKPLKLIFLKRSWFCPNSVVSTILYLEDLKFYTNLETIQKLVLSKDFLCLAALHCIVWLQSFCILFPKAIIVPDRYPLTPCYTFLSHPLSPIPSNSIKSIQLAWAHILAISALQRQKKENHEFQDSLGYIMKINFKREEGLSNIAVSQSYCLVHTKPGIIYPINSAPHM